MISQETRHDKTTTPATVLDALHIIRDIREEWALKGTAYYSICVEAANEILDRLSVSKEEDDNA